MIKTSSLPSTSSSTQIIIPETESQPVRCRTIEEPKCEKKKKKVIRFSKYLIWLLKHLERCNCVELYWRDLLSLSKKTRKGRLHPYFVELCTTSFYSMVIYQPLKWYKSSLPLEIMIFILFKARQTSVTLHLFSFSSILMSFDRRWISPMCSFQTSSLI